MDDMLADLNVSRVDPARYRAWQSVIEHAIGLAGRAIESARAENRDPIVAIIDAAGGTSNTHPVQSSPRPVAFAIRSADQPRRRPAIKGTGQIDVEIHSKKRIPTA
jgi:hypothetical protein